MIPLALAFFVTVTVRGADPECRPLPDPKHLPALDVVVDSAALAGRLQAIDTTTGQAVTVSILMAKAPSGIVFAGQAAQGEPVLAAVLASLRPAAKATPVSFRVIVRLGPVPGLALERSVLCDPESMDAQFSVRVPFTTGVVVAKGTAMPARPRSISPHMRIDREGQVVEVTIGSGSGIPEVDQQVTETIRARRYRPALLDGRPVEVWLSGSRTELVP